MTLSREPLQVLLPLCETPHERWRRLHNGAVDVQLAAAIVTASQDAIVSFTPAGEFLSWNPAAEDLFGFSAAEVIGQSSFDLFVPLSHREEYGALLAEAHDGRPVTRDTVRLRKDGTLLDVEIRASPMRNAAGKIESVAAIYRDVSERKRNEHRQLMLMKELSHRGKNLFAVINSIARLSLASAASMESARDGLMGRLDALQRSYGKLTHAGFDGERLKDIVDSEVEAFKERIHVQGPDVLMKGRAVQTFALIVHELATNASKYGALSLPAGRIKLTWSVSGVGDGRRLRFDWVEGDGPPVAPPQRKGFGTTLIKSIAAFDFECDPELVFEAQGVRYGFETLLSNVGKLVEESPMRLRLKNPMLVKLYDQWYGQLGAKGELPQYRSFERSAFEASGALTIATAGEDLKVRFLEVGRALLDRLGRSLNDDDMIDEDTNSLVEAYHRCAKSAKPLYEHVTFDFGDGDSITFERLLVPYADTGSGVTHMVGMAVFTGSAPALTEASVV